MPIVTRPSPAEAGSWRACGQVGWCLAMRWPRVEVCRGCCWTPPCWPQ
nr:MAG TPA: Trefoil (P-type) domain [Caudoviricetes sp.]